MRGRGCLDIWLWKFFSANTKVITTWGPHYIPTGEKNMFMHEPREGGSVQEYPQAGIFLTLDENSTQNTSHFFSLRWQKCWKKSGASMRWVPGDSGYGSLCSSSANPVPRVSEYFPPIQYFPSIQLLECVSISQWEIPTNPVFQCQSICLALSVNRALPTLHKGPAIPSWSPNSTDLYFWSLRQQTNRKDIAGQSAKPSLTRSIWKLEHWCRWWTHLEIHPQKVATCTIDHLQSIFPCSIN